MHDRNRKASGQRKEFSVRIGITIGHKIIETARIHHPGQIQQQATAGERFQIRTIQNQQIRAFPRQKLGVQRPQGIVFRQSGAFLQGHFILYCTIGILLGKGLYRSTDGSIFFQAPDFQRVGRGRERRIKGIPVQLCLHGAVTDNGQIAAVRGAAQLRNVIAGKRQRRAGAVHYLLTQAASLCLPVDAGPVGITDGAIRSHGSLGAVRVRQKSCLHRLGGAVLIRPAKISVGREIIEERTVFITGRQDPCNVIVAEIVVFTGCIGSRPHPALVPAAYLYPAFYLLGIHIIKQNISRQRNTRSA